MCVAGYPTAAVWVQAGPAEAPVTTIDILRQEQKLPLVLFSFNPLVSKIITRNIYLLSSS